MSDLAWKRKVQVTYGHKLEDPNDKAGFNTWKEFYNYVKDMMIGEAKEFNAVPLEAYQDVDKLDRVWEERVIDHNGTFDHIFELPDEEIYRGDILNGFDFFRDVGAKFMMDIVGGKLAPVLMANDFDDKYVNVSRNFHVITDFPILFWYNLKYSKVWFDPREIDLHFDKSHIIAIPGTEDHMYNGAPEAYITFTVNNIKYAIAGRSHALEGKLDRINELYYYTAVPRGDGIDEWLSDKAADFLKADGIEDGQILYVDYEDMDDVLELFR